MSGRPVCALVLFPLLCGCGGWGGETVEPAPLVEIDDPLRIERRWSAGIGGWGGESRGLRPVLRGERLYLASPGGRLAVLDAATGKTLLGIKGEPIAAGPGVGEGLLLAGTREAEVMAYSEHNGELLWQVRLSGEVLSSPRAAAGKVLVRTLDGKLFALSVENGRTLWVHSDTIPPLSLYGTSAPLLHGDSTVLAGFDSGRLVNIELDSGLPIWEIEVATPSGDSELERMIDIDAELTLAGNFLLSAGYQGRLIMADLLTGQVAWGHVVSTFHGAAFDAGAGESGQVYVADEKGRLTALDATTGEPVWEHELLLHRRLSPPAAYADYVVCPDSEGYLHWFHRQDGRPVGRLRTGNRGAHTTLLVHGELLIVHAGGKVAAYSVE